MEYKALVSAAYQSIDSADAAKFASFITPDGIFRFANIPAVKGNKAISDFVAGFFKSLKGISHSNLESWSVDNVIFINGIVKYTRHNNTTLQVPFSCTWKMKDGLIDEYLIFIDNSELYK
jgi:hypothetical protein